MTVTSAAAAPGLASPGLAEELARLGGFDAQLCMNCGICTATCPLGIDVLPRRVMRYAVLGLGERVRAESEAVFSCLLCRACEENCPAGVHIAGNVRLLRRWLLEEGH
jgi:heterodisulfide reductase subunit C2